MRYADERFAVWGVAGGRMAGLEVETLHGQGLGWLLETGFLGSLAAAERTALLASASWRDLDRGDEIVTLGQTRAGVDLIVAGQAHVFAPDGEGEVRLIARVGPGHVIG